MSFTFTGNPVIDGLLVAGAVITALGIIWGKAVRPVVHMATQAEVTLPVILAIAKEFKANGGSSLRATIDAIATTNAEQVSVLSDYAHTAKHDMVDKLAAVSGHQELLTEEVHALAEKVDRLTDDVAEIKQIVDRRHGERGSIDNRGSGE